MPYPVRTFTTPGGNTSAQAWPSIKTPSGATSEALRTIVLPVQMAGAIFWAARETGEFQGTIAPTTPYGSRRV